jgi:hypothetical protein
MKHAGFLIGQRGRLYPPSTPWNAITPTMPKRHALLTTRNMDPILFVNGCSELSTELHEERVLSNAAQAQVVSNAMQRPVIALRNERHWRPIEYTLIGAARTHVMPLEWSTPTVHTLMRVLFVSAIKKEGPRLIVTMSGGINYVQEAMRFLLHFECVTSQQLRRFTIVTLANSERRYIAGPRYFHVVDTRDWIPWLWGVNKYKSKNHSMKHPVDSLNATESAFIAANTRLHVFTSNGKSTRVHCIVNYATALSSIMS